MIGRRALIALAAMAIGSVGAVMGAGSTAVGASRAEQLPAGFTDASVAAIRQPIALAQTPDGRVLVLDDTGFIRVVKNDVLLTKPALNIKAKVCSKGEERGLLGIAVDPSFASNGYVYVYYTFKKFGTCPRFTADVPVNRVSRFTMVGDTIDPASEDVLIDNMLSYAGEHNAGDVGFGKDGMLYVTTGDGGCDYTVGRKACDGPTNSDGISQKLNTLQGKVLRIAPDGSIPADNPYTGAGTARCNQGYVATGLKCREIDASGFRNPFRFAFDPNAARTRLFVNDVGESVWDEIDHIVSGANYGWNVREGDCAENSTVDCGPPPAGMTNPIFEYEHASTGCAAITGGAFVPAGVWGASYAGGYLYGDYICNKIFLLMPKAGGGWTSTVFASGLAPGGPIAMQFGTREGRTVLYYTTYTGTNGNPGQLHVIAQTP